MRKEERNKHKGHNGGNTLQGATPEPESSTTTTTTTKDENWEER